MLDLNIGGSSGLRLIEPLLAANPDCRILVLTGYASIATTVDAIKLGATQYLAKPADVDSILKALSATDVVIEDEVSAGGRCRWIGSSGNTSSACSPKTMATSRPPPAPSKCTGAPCNANWPNAPSRNEEPSHTTPTASGSTNGCGPPASSSTAAWPPRPWMAARSSSTASA